MHKFNHLLASVLLFFVVIYGIYGKISIESFLIITMIYLIGSAILFSLKRIIELKEK